MAVYKHHYTPSPNPPKDFKLGELDEAWIDDMQRRMFLELEHQLTCIEQSSVEDPKKDIRRTLDLMERMLRVRRMMREERRMPKRKRRNRS